MVPSDGVLWIYVCVFLELAMLSEPSVTTQEIVERPRDRRQTVRSRTRRWTTRVWTFGRESRAVVKKLGAGLGERATREPGRTGGAGYGPS